MYICIVQVETSWLRCSSLQDRIWHLREIC